MKLYDEDGRAVVVKRIGFVGSGMYGRVYRTSDLKCLKSLNKSSHLVIKM